MRRMGRFVGCALLAWAGIMGKAHCLNNNNKKKKKQITKGRAAGGSGSSQKVREKKLGEEGFEKEEERG